MITSVVVEFGFNEYRELKAYANYKKIDFFALFSCVTDLYISSTAASRIRSLPCPPDTFLLNGDNLLKN